MVIMKGPDNKSVVITCVTVEDIPYSWKFSLVKIFADWPFLDFHGSVRTQAPPTSRLISFTNTWNPEIKIFAVNNFTDCD